MDKKLFLYLKRRGIFTSGDQKTLREYLTNQEIKSEDKSRIKSFTEEETEKIKLANSPKK